MNNKIQSLKSVPLPEFGDFRHNTLPQIIGMLNQPITSILTGQSDHSKLYHYPFLQKSDLSIIAKLDKLFFLNKVNTSHFPPSVLQRYEYSGNISLSAKKFIDSNNYLCSRLSFMNYLIDRTLSEISIYLENGIKIMQLENIAAPYFVREQLPVENIMIMNYLLTKIREHYPALPLGIQMLAQADNIALELAINHKLFYVRGESFLFRGERPEGITPNYGNLAKAYYLRQLFNLHNNNNPEYPKIYPDILKKHTIFPSEISSLKQWLDNIGFMKLEGVIITGESTGQPVKEEHLSFAREAIDNYYEKTLAMGYGVSIPLITGSGADNDNVSWYKKYANALIVGSVQKEFGFWECDIDIQRLKRFMDAFNS